MACSTIYKRHHPDPDKAKYDDVLECTRCGKTKFELESGGVQWMDNPDAPLGAALDA